MSETLQTTSCEVPYAYGPKRLELNDYADNVDLTLDGDSYTPGEVAHAESFLAAYGAFTFEQYDSGLFPAAGLPGQKTGTDYDAAWLRDQAKSARNVEECGDVENGRVATEALLKSVTNQTGRIDDILGKIENGNWNRYDLMDRIHIRFDPVTFELFDRGWCHAQNDAIGLTIISYSDMARRGIVQPEEKDMLTLALVGKYLEAIDYAEDYDSGAWEGGHQRRSSSIALAMTGLKSLKALMESKGLESLATKHFDKQGDKIDHGDLTIEMLDAQIAKGNASLDRILPNEYNDNDGHNKRTVDAAQLIPMHYGAFDDRPGMNETILENVERELYGKIGIKRWTDDGGYFGPQSGKKEDFAEWWFNSTISHVYGRLARMAIAADDIEKCSELFARQEFYLKRSLGEVTVFNEGKGIIAVPEMHHKNWGEYSQVNKHTPLVWAATDLQRALHSMQETHAVLATKEWPVALDTPGETIA